MPRAAHIDDLDRLRAAHAKAAEIVVEDAAYAPIFERLEAELRDAEARQADDPVARARAVLMKERA